MVDKLSVERMVGSRRGEGKQATLLSALVQCMLLNFTADCDVFVLSLPAVFVRVRKGGFEGFIFSSSNVIPLLLPSGGGELKPASFSLQFHRQSMFSWGFLPWLGPIVTNVSLAMLLTTSDTCSGALMKTRIRRHAFNQANLITDFIHLTNLINFHQIRQHSASGLGVHCMCSVYSFPDSKHLEFVASAEFKMKCCQ